MCVVDYEGDVCFWRDVVARFLLLMMMVVKLRFTKDRHALCLLVIASS